MYKLWNMLFGWDYIGFSRRGSYGEGTRMGIARVYRDHNGMVYFIDNKKAFPVGEPGMAMWLTCPPEHYFGEQNGN